MTYYIQAKEVCSPTANLLLPLINTSTAKQEYPATKNLHFILNLGSEMSGPIPAKGVKFANPPLDLGLKYHDPPPLV